VLVERHETILRAARRSPGRSSTDRREEVGLVFMVTPFEDDGVKSCRQDQRGVGSFFQAARRRLAYDGIALGLARKTSFPPVRRQGGVSPHQVEIDGAGNARFQPPDRPSGRFPAMLTRRSVCRRQPALGDEAPRGGPSVGVNLERAIGRMEARRDRAAQKVLRRCAQYIARPAGNGR